MLRGQDATGMVVTLLVSPKPSKLYFLAAGYKSMYNPVQEHTGSCSMTFKIIIDISHQWFRQQLIQTREYLSLKQV